MAYSKVCKKCLLEKPLEEFRVRKDNGHYRHTCKECEKKYRYEYIKEHKQIEKTIRNNYYKKHREEILNKMSSYYQKNKNDIQKRRKINRELNKEELNMKARLRNKKNRKNISKRENIRFHSDNLFKIKKQIRTNIRVCFQKKGYRKMCKTKDILGCSFDYFYSYLLDTFKNNYGYEWDKKEPVHIDHIIPLATAKTEEDVIKLCHYSNLQLLKAQDNLQKSAKLNYTLKEEKLCM